MIHPFLLFTNAATGGENYEINSMLKGYFHIKLTFDFIVQMAILLFFFKSITGIDGFY